MSSATDVIVNIVCPLVGVLISNAMWLSPYSLVMKARQNRHLGDVNPIPFAMTFVNNIGWVVYSAMLSNYYIFFSSIFGIIFGLFYTVTCLTIIAKEAYEDEFTTLYVIAEGMLLGGLFFWSMIGIVQTSIFKSFDDPDEQATKMVGYLCAFFNICYYAAPLSSMFQVIATKNASSLYLPAILVNSLNATMWLCYGAFGQNNPVVWGPSLIGLLLSMTQVVLVIRYHKGPWIHAIKGATTEETIKVKSRVDDGNSRGNRTMSFLISDVASTGNLNASIDLEEERLRTLTWSGKEVGMSMKTFVLSDSPIGARKTRTSTLGSIRSAKYSQASGQKPNQEQMNPLFEGDLE
eukprot:gene1475-1604_t